MKRFLPFIILLTVLVLWLILPLPQKGLVIILIFIELIGVPLTVLSIYRKKTFETQLFVIIGFLFGAMSGFYMGAKVVDIIMTMIYGDMSKYSIRLDSLGGALLGAFIFSILGALAGAYVSRWSAETKKKAT